MVGKTKHRTKADEKHLDVTAEIGCIPCLLDNYPDIPATIQHVTEAGRRNKDQHQHVYGSCPWHHQGQAPPFFVGSTTQCEVMYRPSFARNKRVFEERYGPEEVLVQVQHAINRICRSAYQRGEYLPATEVMDLVQKIHLEIMSNV